MRYYGRTNKSTQELQPNSLYEQAWELVKKVWRSYYKVLAVFFLLAIFVEYSLEKAEESKDEPLLLIVQFASICIIVILQSGLFYSLIRLVRGKAIKIDHLFSQKKLWVRFFIATIAYQLLVVLGLVLLIIPGIYWMLKYSQYGYLLIDKQLSVSDAFKQSGELTEGLLRKIGEMFMIGIVVNLLGLAALGIGVFITLPITLLAFTFLYESLLSRKAPLHHSMNS